MFWRGSIWDLTFSSVDPKYTKIVIKTVDVSARLVEDVEMAGAVVHGNTCHSSEENGGRIRRRGRDLGLFATSE